MSNNRIEAPMIAPDNGGSKFNLRPNLQIPDEGPRQMLLIGIIDIGTHVEKSGQGAGQEKRKMFVMFEKPDLRQLVYEEDTEPRTWTRSEEMGYSMYKNAKLFKIAKAIVGAKYTDEQLEKGINLFELLGGRCYVTVVHKPNPKDPNNPYVNFENFSRVGNDPAPADFISDGKRYAFYIDAEGKNFMTDNFAELPAWLRKRIMESKEAVEYAAKGGKFAEPKSDDNSDNSGVAAPPPSAGSAPVPAGFEFKDLSGQNLTYEQYLKSGWTDKQLYKAGYLVKVQQVTPPTPPPAAAPTPPTPPQQPITPPPAQEPPVQTPPPAQNGYNPFDNDDDDDLPF